MNFFDENIEEQNPDEPQVTNEEVGLDAVITEDDNTAYTITSRNSSRNTYILLGVCLLAIVGVWFAGFAHKHEEQDKKKSSASKLDVVLARLVGIKNTGDSQDLVNAFYELPGAKQVKLDELNKNPFILEQKVEEQDQAPVVKIIDRQKVLAAEIQSLRLGSIMQRSNGSICLINGVVYKVGDKVTDSFIIKEIKVDSVILEAEDWECELEM